MPEAKSDMERVGIFKEMSYISIGDKFQPFNYCPFNESAYKHKQMLVSSPKKKSALQAGYFDSHFKRIFENEALTDLIKIQREYRIQQAKKNLAKAFVPSSGEKKPSGTGSCYGTFGGPVQAMSPTVIPKKTYKSPGKNLYTSPPKKGSGYGENSSFGLELNRVDLGISSSGAFLNQLKLKARQNFPGVTLSKLDLYSSEPYDRARELVKHDVTLHKSLMKGGPFHLNLPPRECFDNNPYKADKVPEHSKMAEEKKTHFAVPFKPSSPSKKIGGMKAGTFDSYPIHSVNPYILKKSRSATTDKERKIFHSSFGPKSTPVKSIISINVNKMVNSANYKQLPSVMV